MSYTERKLNESLMKLKRKMGGSMRREKSLYLQEIDNVD